MMSFKRYIYENEDRELTHGQEIKHSHPGMSNVKYTVRKNENGSFDIVDDDGNVATSVYAPDTKMAREIARKEGYSV